LIVCLFVCLLVCSCTCAVGCLLSASLFVRSFGWLVLGSWFVRLLGCLGCLFDCLFVFGFV